MATATENFVFVLGNASGKQRKRTSADRSHTARQIWKKQRMANSIARVKVTDTQPVSGISLYEHKSSQAAPRLLDSALMELDADCISTSITNHVNGCISAPMTPYNYSRALSARRIDMLVNPCPIFGGANIETFRPDQAVVNAEVIDRFMQTLITGMLSERDKRIWFSSICSNGLVYHTVNYIVNTMRDMYENKESTKDTLTHKGNILRILKARVEDEAQLQTESGPLVLAVSALWMLNRSRSLLPVRSPSLFTPHMPPSTPSHMVGSVEHDAVHLEAFRFLFTRTGWMEEDPNLPNLRRSVAHAVVLWASAHAKDPHLQVYQDLSAKLASAPGVVCPGFQDHSHQFSRSVPGGLPPDALSVLDWLKHLDHCFAAREIDASLLLEYLVVAQFKLLELPRWTPISPEDPPSPAMYEICRLTSLIYSNAVLMSIDFDAPWVIHYLTHLQKVLEIVNPEMWENQCGCRVLIWSLYVASMVAWFTPLRPNFYHALQRTLSVNGIEAWSQVRDILVEFLWEDCACENGAFVVWNALRNG